MVKQTHREFAGNRRLAGRLMKRIVSHFQGSIDEELRPFGGVRIEDNVATTAGNPENMTRDAFAALAH